MKQLEHPVGFFAPYLSREDRAEWNARARLPGPRLLSDKASLNQAIQEVGAEYGATLGNLEETASKVNAYYSDLSICIKCFFHDTHFKTMALSYIEPNGKLISRSWIKQSQ